VSGGTADIARRQVGLKAQRLSVAAVGHSAYHSSKGPRQ
jgi:hypothetical protein